MLVPAKSEFYDSLETRDPEVRERELLAALRFVGPERIIPAPDCGMKYIPRATAFAKLKALAEGAAIVRRELHGRH